MSLLAVREVSKRYGPVVALRSATLVVEPGEIHALLGANGAGKSTLVKVLTGVSGRLRTILVRHGNVLLPARAGDRTAPVLQVGASAGPTVAQNIRLTGTRWDAVRST